jgi:hypothetical protein
VCFENNFARELFFHAIFTPCTHHLTTLATHTTVRTKAEKTEVARRAAETRSRNKTAKQAEAEADDAADPNMIRSSSPVKRKATNEAQASEGSSQRQKHRHSASADNDNNNFGDQDSTQESRTGSVALQTPRIPRHTSTDRDNSEFEDNLGQDGDETENEQSVVNQPSSSGKGRKIATKSVRTKGKRATVSGDAASKADQARLDTAATGPLRSVKRKVVRGKLTNDDIPPGLPRRSSRHLLRARTTLCSGLCASTVPPTSSSVRILSISAEDLLWY